METTRTHVSTGAGMSARRQTVRDPDSIPNYDLLQFIGAGGFGQVWLARERITGVRRAVKLLYRTDAERAARDIDGVRQYQQAAHNHPNLLQILTVGETPRCFYYVMEAADNRLSRAGGAYEATTLRTQMQTTGRLDARAALQLLAKLGAAVGRLHAQSLAHYDLKPENILIAEGQPKIGDVGLVAAIRGRAPGSGTPAYMTPEGKADDVYALGKLLYELVTGRPAADFPRLPPEMLTDRTPETAAALRIFNRACHSDPHHRFDSIEAFTSTCQAALKMRSSLRRHWTQMSSRARRFAAAAATIMLVGVLIVSGWMVYHFGGPWLVHEQVFDFSRNEFALVRGANDDDPAKREYAHIYLDGIQLERPGRYALPLATLPQPVDDFILDVHVRCPRPWGTFGVGLAKQDNGCEGAHMSLYGQADGLGLETRLALRSVSDVVLESPAIAGHPQPGLEYVVRLTRCREKFVLALWPLAQPTPEPLVRSIPVPNWWSGAKYAVLSCRSVDPCARIEVLSAHVAVYTAPLDRAVALAPPEVVGALYEWTVKPAIVPALPREFLLRSGENLLAGRLHPSFTTAWMSIGNWGWWLGEDPNVVRCSPFSTNERGHPARTDADFDGLQLLRFDCEAFADFEAVLKIRLTSPPDEANRDPFACRSHDSTVGLAFRLQDEAPPGCAWGGGYLARLVLHPKSEIPAEAYALRFRGLGLNSEPDYEIRACGDKPRHLATSKLELNAHSELLAPDGFTLRFRMEGPDASMFLNDHPEPLLVATDPAADYFREGRIALCATRLIATFESLEITPLNTE